jgi:hypothetical protein
MKIQHFINGSPPVGPVTVIEWQLTYNKSMEGPVLQARTPGCDWHNVLGIGADGLLDPTYSPGVRGLPVNDEGYIQCVPSYPDGEE